MDQSIFYAEVGGGQLYLQWGLSVGLNGPK